MLGPPGAGKSIWARRLTTILPAMTLPEALETTRIHSVLPCVTITSFRTVAHLPHPSRIEGDLSIFPLPQPFRLECVIVGAGVISGNRGGNSQRFADQGLQ
jgi:hypothetical protein